jgi:hypothetical protein
MSLVLQYTSTLSPGETQYLYNWGWDYGEIARWYVMPTLTGFNVGKISLERTELESTIFGGNQQGTLTYWMTVTNTGGYPVEYNLYWETVPIQ